MTRRSRSLRALNIPGYVDTSSHDVADVLYNPCLSVSVSYDRGVGFFSSSWLRHVAEGLAPFAERGGKMRLITSPKLQAEDWTAIKQGEDARNNPALLAQLMRDLQVSILNISLLGVPISLERSQSDISFSLSSTLTSFISLSGSRDDGRGKEDDG